jgi:succinate-semialdehyde dehydrogenase / glutarate-semialdehyde dehydrogenase
LKIDARSLFQEEIFAPVALVYSFDDIDEAVQLANRSPYALGSGVFCHEKKMAEAILAKVNSGLGFWNDYVRSSPDTLLGGIQKWLW